MVPSPRPSVKTPFERPQANSGAEERAPDLLRLTVTGGPAARRVFDRPPRLQTVLTIGRTKASRLHIKDPAVSEKHGELRWSAAGWELRDLGSSNGTTVNGRALSADGKQLHPEVIFQCHPSMGMLLVILTWTLLQPSLCRLAYLWCLRCYTSSRGWWSLGCRGSGAAERRRCHPVRDGLYSLCRGVHGLHHTTQSNPTRARSVGEFASQLQEMGFVCHGL